jgi:hypothetical protein
MRTLVPMGAMAARIALVLAGVAGVGAALAYAEATEITVTRESPNLYRIDGTNRLIKTYDCYEYAAFAEEAILNHEQDSEKYTLYFVYSGETCEVERLVTEK